MVFLKTLSIIGERMEIGVDCLEINRFSFIRTNQKFQQKIFTQNEIDYCIMRRSCEQHFAVRFAGKEAVKKALSQYKIELPINKIEILNDHEGKPYVKILDERGSNFRIKISLSHSKYIAIAFAIVCNEKRKSE